MTKFTRSGLGPSILLMLLRIVTLYPSGEFDNVNLKSTRRSL